MCSMRSSASTSRAKNICGPWASITLWIPALRNYLLGFRDMDTGHIIENVVYFELLRRGYDVAIGKVGNLEVDFIASNAKDKIYFQVTESMNEPSTRERGVGPHCV